MLKCRYKKCRVYRACLASKPHRSCSDHGCILYSTPKSCTHIKKRMSKKAQMRSATKFKRLYNKEKDNEVRYVDFELTVIVGGRKISRVYTEDVSYSFTEGYELVFILNLLTDLKIEHDIVVIPRSTRKSCGGGKVAAMVFGNFMSGA